MPFLFQFLRLTFVVVIISEELLCLMLLENWLQELCKTTYSGLQRGNCQSCNVALGGNAVVQI